MTRNAEAAESNNDGGQAPVGNLSTAELWISPKNHQNEAVKSIVDIEEKKS